MKMLKFEFSGCRLLYFKNNDGTREYDLDKNMNV